MIPAPPPLDLDLAQTRYHVRILYVQCGWCGNRAATAIRIGPGIMAMCEHCASKYKEQLKR